jgi:hypothetical protein
MQLLVLRFYCIQVRDKLRNIGIGAIASIYQLRTGIVNKEVEWL